MTGALYGVKSFESFRINKTLKQKTEWILSRTSFESFRINKTLKPTGRRDHEREGFESFRINKTLKQRPMTIDDITQF